MDRPHSTAPATARALLLDRIIQDVARHGLGSRSLRDIAAAVGSSHRMLHFHFGSRDGLVEAIVAETETRQRALMVASATESNHIDPADLIMETWRRVSDPAMLPLIQLFFETIAHRSPGAPDLTTEWIDAVSEIDERPATETNRVDARLGVAVVRGLLIDLVTGADAAEATAAMRRFVSLMSTERPDALR
jgi:AcrR family transcriptional regulator